LPRERFVVRFRELARDRLEFVLLALQVASFDEEEVVGLRTVGEPRHVGDRVGHLEVAVDHLGGVVGFQ